MGSMAAQAREDSRRAALQARTAAVRTLPVVAVVWLLVVVFVPAALVLRVVTLAAIALSVMLAGRAAVTARTFLHRWGDPDARRPPPMWVTLAAVGCAVGTFVAGANLAADIDQGRSTVRATALGTAFLAVTLAAAYAHIAGARGLAAALRARADLAGVRGLGPGSEGDPNAVGGPEAVRFVAAPMTELRQLMAACPASGDPHVAIAALVADFRQRYPAEVVSAAHAELAALRAHLLHERTLAQVVTLLGCAYHPPDDGLSYTAWVSRLDAELAGGPASPASAGLTGSGPGPGPRAVG